MGKKSEFAFRMLSSNFLDYLNEIICLIAIILFTIGLEFIRMIKYVRF